MQSLLRIAGFQSGGRIRTKASMTSVWQTVLGWPALLLVTTWALLGYPLKVRHTGADRVTLVIEEQRRLTSQLHDEYVQVDLLGPAQSAGGPRGSRATQGSNSIGSGRALTLP